MEGWPGREGGREGWDGGREGLEGGMPVEGCVDGGRTEGGDWTRLGVKDQLETLALGRRG